MIFPLVTTFYELVLLQHFNQNDEGPSKTSNYFLQNFQVHISKLIDVQKLQVPIFFFGTQGQCQGCNSQ